MMACIIKGDARFCTRKRQDRSDFRLVMSWKPFRTTLIHSVNTHRRHELLLKRFISNTDVVQDDPVFKITV